ncbi:uncharacterized protein LOC143448387 [Clavelina lepadiformis]|uniref:uncharacterized protein LOC143448387 n=1 Tax=Clavelina lepadiformis TaxID=159417 RepID=UPI00404391B1
MSNDRDSTIDKFSSETCRIGRSKTLAVLAKSKKNKPSQKESPFLNLRKNSDKAFKAQIVPQSFPHNNTLSVLEHRLSSNLAILVPLLKRSCPNNLLQIERLDSGGKLIRENPEQPEVNKKLQAPCSLPPSRHPQISSSPSLHNHHRRKKRRQVLYSILPIALSSQLLPRSNNLSQLSSRQNFGENFSAGEKGSVVSKEECEQNYNKNDHKQGDTLNFHKVNKNDLSVETEPLDVLPSRQKHIIKQLRVRDLSPVVSCGGKIGLAVPTCLSQTCVDPRTVKAHIRRQLTLQSGWKTSRRLGLNRFSSSKKSLALPLLSGSNKSSSSHSSLLSYSTESVCSSESMSSTSHPAKQPKAPNYYAVYKADGGSGDYVISRLLVCFLFNV